jgi:Fic family protein
MSKNDHGAERDSPDLVDRRASDRRWEASRALLIQRIRSEFLEMPGLCLTAPQISRLCGISEDACSRVLAELVETGTLQHAGQYYGISLDVRSAAHATRPLARRRID